MKFENVEVSLLLPKVNLQALADDISSSLYGDDIVNFVKRIFEDWDYEESPEMKELYWFFKTAKKEAKK